MTVLAERGPAATTRPPDVSAAAPAPGRGALFWIRRYLPAEIVGTAVMLMAGLAVSVWISAPAAIAIAALLGETVGFYAVLAVVIYVEQARVARTRRRAAIRTLLLLVAEFGVAELLDTFLVRPTALYLGVLWIPDPVWGLLAGKIAADLLFYAVAAGAFLVTARTGLRDAHPSAEDRS